MTLENKLTWCLTARMKGGRASIYILTFDMSCINSSSSSDRALLWLLLNVPHALWSSCLSAIRATKLTEVTLAWWLDLLILQPTLSISRLHLIWVISFVFIFKLGWASISVFEKVFSCLLVLLSCSKSWTSSICQWFSNCRPGPTRGGAYVAQ